MKQPNVYIGEVKDIPWTPNTEPDDDDELESTPQEVVQILGFDPMEIGNENPRGRETL